MLLLLSVLILLTQPLGYLEEEVKTCSQNTVINGCTLVMCGSVKNDPIEGIISLRQQVEALQRQVQYLQATFTQYKKAELFPNGRGIGEKIFKTGGFENSFKDAQKVCEQAGGQLASPRSAAENAALRELVSTQNKSAFLSMTDIKTEGKFIYPTGEPLVYSNWQRGEPNNHGGEENCVEIFTSGKWNDQNCNKQRLVVCEF
ncbi:Pulmonary surfactant-associated protein D [Tupaia chinensis]|uniref:Pulmonary surfactant-associated protein D n=1 Tax=Tupaia chinensis TaxID=246437 RepID=L9KFH1_TUPCH|nr:Pulmonary surfactant-associated protein D [Tupaia chinensis]